MVHPERPAPWLSLIPYHATDTQWSIEPIVQKAEVFVPRGVLQPWRDDNSEFPLCKGADLLQQSCVYSPGSKVFQIRKYLLL